MQTSSLRRITNTAIPIETKKATTSEARLSVKKKNTLFFLGFDYDNGEQAVQWRVTTIDDKYDTSGYSKYKPPIITLVKKLHTHVSIAENINLITYFQSH